MKKRYLMLTLLLIVALLLPPCAGCAKKQKKYTDQAFEWFDSYYSLTVYTDSQEKFDDYAALCRAILTEYHQLFDSYHTYDGVVNLKSINEADGTPLTVSPKLFEFLTFSREIHDLTHGYTNIAMGSVIALWQHAREQANAGLEAVPPSEQAITDALTHTALSSLQMTEDSFSVAVSDPQMSLHAGAIGKGYAAQKTAKALQDAGCSSFLLDLGGNVVAYGQKPGNEPWRVGIRTPDGHAGYDGSITLSGTALVTSGSYERYFMANGVRYHHILHPETGFPSQDFVSVSVLCHNSALADALSTALFSMPLSDGMALIETFADTEAVWMLSDGQTVCSQGFERYATGGAS